MAPLWNVTDSYYEEMVAELETRFSREGANFSRHYNLPLLRGSNSARYIELLHDLFRYTPPSCIILHDLTHFLPSASFFLQNGKRIPDDISVILLYDNPMLGYMSPSIAHFSLFTADIIRRAYHVLREQMSGLRFHKQEEITPVWVPGDSLAAPKSR